MLHVTAKDKATGKSQNIRIEASSGLSDEEIKKMKAEAEANAETDKKVKEETEKVNQADTMIFQTEKQLKDYSDKLPADKKEAIEKALNDLREAHKNRDIAAIDTTLATLNTAWQAASEDMYKATQNAGPGAEGQPSADGGSQAKTDSEVTDVDFEEVKEDKK